MNDKQKSKMLRDENNVVKAIHLLQEGKLPMIITDTRIRQMMKACNFKTKPDELWNILRRLEKKNKIEVVKRGNRVYYKQLVYNVKSGKD